LEIDASAIPNFALNQGLLRYKSRFWIGADAELQKWLIDACHSSALGGHSRIPVTYRRIKKMFACKGMKTVVSEYVNACMVCQQAKLDRSKSPGLLHPLLVPVGAWQTISIDFMEGLP
jgi:hypothetical protein